MKFLPALLLFVLLASVSTVTAQKRPPRPQGLVKNQLNSPKAQIAMALLRVVAQEAIEALAENTESLPSFPCAKLSKAPDNQGITIDFGDSCQTKLGHTSSGKVTIFQRTSPDEPFKITLDNFAINGHEIGSHKLIELETTEEGN